MQTSAFQLARRVAPTVHRDWIVILTGTIAALLGPLLLIDLGLIVQLLVSRDSGALPTDWLIGSIVSGKFGRWPFFGSHEFCLLVLVGFGWLIALIQSLMFMLLRRRSHMLAMRIASDLRQKIYSQAFRLGPYDLLGATRSRPDELFAERVETVRRGFVYWWFAVPYAFVAVVALTLVAAAVHVWLTLLAILLTLIMLRFYRAARQQEEARKAYWRDQVHQQDALLRDLLHRAPLLKGYSLIEPPVASFDQALKATGQAESQLARSEYLLHPAMLLFVLLAAGFLLLIIGFAPNVYVSGTVVVCGAWLTAYFPFVRIIRLSTVVTEMNSAAQDITSFLDRDPSVVQLPDAKPLDRLGREILLERVHLADRHGRHLLDEVAVTIPARHRVAVLASDPQTPLALAGLFVRFYDPTAGVVRFDDHDICSVTLDTIRGQSALVLQDGLLFPGTIAQNITCGDSGFTAVQIQDALKNACAADFIHGLPHGLSTVISTENSGLRPDQAFRIGLARALLREPSLLVVQEPKDHGSEVIAKELDDALTHAAIDRTLIILPERISTLRTADVIYFFHEGKLHAHGKHADLLQASELYRHLCYVRFNPYRTTVA